MVSRFARWYEERPVAGDACLAAVLLLFVVPADLASDTGTVGADLAFSLALVACVPFRRLAPVAVFAAVACSASRSSRCSTTSSPATSSRWMRSTRSSPTGRAPRSASRRPRARFAGALLAAARWDDSSEDVSLFDAAASTVVSMLLAAALGAWRRSRRAQLAALALERDQQAAVGAAIERARIARELHDVIAHSLSVIVVQADGAAAGAEQRPAAAAQALRTIGDTGRDALAQMRRLLGVLRSDQGTGVAPQPGADQLEALVAQVARAGLPAELRVEGERRPLDGTVDVAVYRVAQEALTNVLKHAGDVSRVDVLLRYRDDAVELVVRDDGRGGRARRRRPRPRARGDARAVDLHDGTLAAGPRQGGGFEVRTVIPA